MDKQSLKGITNLGEWVTWDPDTSRMVIGTGGSFIFHDGIISEYSSKTFKDKAFLDAGERLLTPGLIDPHTHPAFADLREVEFELRGQGKSYLEIAAAGGGIRNSVRRLRHLPEDELTERIRHRLMLMMQYGTTTVECKSGYGLSWESEQKSLRAIQAASNDLPLRTFSTFLGAHEVPDEYRDNRDAYIRLLVDEMIPKVAAEKLADFCDVFCETGVYSAEESRRILNSAKKYGLGLRIHADEFESTGGAQLAAEIGALSADHLMAISEEGIQALARSGTVGTLLPGTTFFLGESKWAPARKMLEAGVVMALATDFNPGSSMTVSMPFMMTLAVIYLHLTPLEALKAATYGSAKALGLENEVGALHKDYHADCVLWNCTNHRELPYFYAVNQVNTVIIQGQKIVADPYEIQTGRKSNP